jgi:coenzyme F420-reducing hydrogenase beta subunit
MTTNQCNDLQAVLDHDLCIACGACIAANPSLKLFFNDMKQMFEPDGPGDEAAASVCPSIRVDYEGLQNFCFPDSPISPLGVIDRVMLSQSKDYERNLKSSSGGTIKELLHMLLTRNDVDGIISLDHIAGLDFEARLVEKPEDIDNLPGSIYHNVPFDNALKILKEGVGKKYVLIAIPCQLEGIYSYIRKFDPELKNRINMTIGLICGWTYSHHSIRAICKFKGVDYRGIQGISFRGGGPVGKLSIQYPNKHLEVNRRVDFDYQVAFDRSFNVHRCHFCINHSNFLADIVVGDAWLPSTVHTKTGVSLIICRNKTATEMIHNLESDNKVSLLLVTEAEVEESQTRQVVYGDHSYAYACYRKEKGLFAPDLVGPNFPEAMLYSPKSIEKFSKTFIKKVALQRSSKYMALKYRKMTIELWPFLKRYLRWFFVRILKIKSMTGQRKEIPKDKTSIFR